MADETITVEWISTAQQMLSTIQKIDTKIERQEKLMQKLADTSKKGVKEIAGSFNALENELKENEAALKKLVIGTKAFEDQRKKVDDLRNSVKKAKGELSGMVQQTNQQTASAFSSAMSQMGQLVVGMIGFQQVVSAVNDELTHIRQLKLDAAGTTRTLEQALADVGQNIGGAAVPQARQMILEESPKLGVTQEGLADLLGVAISAGAKDLEEALSLSSAALKLTVGDAAKARALVGSTLDVASLGGSKNFEGALGQLLQTQSQVRSTNLAEFGANIGPGLAAATADLSQQKGVSTERAMEMASVISQIIKDQTGSNTATTMRMMFTRMGSFVPEKSVKLDDGGTAKVTGPQIEAFKALNTFDDRLKMMSDVPAIGAQFLETQRESIGKTAISEIVNRSARAVAFEDKAKQSITGIDQAQGFFKELETVLVGETAHLGAARRAQAALEVGRVEGDRDTQGQVLDIIEKGLADVNLSGVDKLTKFKLLSQVQANEVAGVDPFVSGRSVLSRAKGMAFGTSPAEFGAPMSAVDKATIDRQIDALNKLEAALREIRPAARPAAPARNARPGEAPLPGALIP